MPTREEASATVGSLSNGGLQAVEAAVVAHVVALEQILAQSNSPGSWVLTLLQQPEPTSQQVTQFLDQAFADGPLGQNDLALNLFS